MQSLKLGGVVAGGDLGATQQSAVVGTAGGASSLGYDAFLKLLVAQMQNQDPMDPTNSTDYVAQLATFSQVEKSVQMNERIRELLSVSRMQQAESIVGRMVDDGVASGIVVAARVVGDEVVAVIEGGREVVLGPSVTISMGDEGA